ncbi:hypothetical protein D623_10003018 [Myotis brandtii]|uniref:Uncharacterized protein n=1 Tax=Myotis brandtii TaxID=109478 RepID=S7NN17_MYOBR|nr:hypothetical protein D623_10003018 [Myotis brandtii]
MGSTTPTWPTGQLNAVDWGCSSEDKSLVLEAGVAGPLHPAKEAGEIGRDHSKPEASLGQSCVPPAPTPARGVTRRQRQLVEAPGTAAQLEQQK